MGRVRNTFFLRPSRLAQALESRTGSIKQEGFRVGEDPGDEEEPPLLLLPELPESSRPEFPFPDEFMRCGGNKKIPAATIAATNNNMVSTKTGETRRHRRQPEPSFLSSLPRASSLDGGGPVRPSTMYRRNGSVCWDVTVAPPTTLALIVPPATLCGWVLRLSRLSCRSSPLPSFGRGSITGRVGQGRLDRLGEII